MTVVSRQPLLGRAGARYAAETRSRLYRRRVGGVFRWGSGGNLGGIHRGRASAHYGFGSRSPIPPRIRWPIASTAHQPRCLSWEGSSGPARAPNAADLRARLAELLAVEGDQAGIEVHQEAGTDRLADLVNEGGRSNSFIQATVLDSLTWTGISE